MSDLIVQSAIEGALITWAAAQSPVLPVAVANGDYAPVVGTSYLKGSLIPADTQNFSMGGKHKHYQGFYQVDVRIPIGGGVGDALVITKAIEVLFKAPTSISNSGPTININHTPSTGPGMADGAGFWVTPVTIRYDMDDFS